MPHFQCLTKANTGNLIRKLDLTGLIALHPNQKSMGSWRNFQINILALPKRLFRKTDYLEYTAVTFRKKLLKTKQPGFCRISYSIYLLQMILSRDALNCFCRRCSRITREFYRLQILDLVLDLLDHNLQGIGLSDLGFQKALQLILIKTLVKIY